MLVECTTCPVAGRTGARPVGASTAPDGHCADCVVTILLELPPAPFALDDDWPDSAADLDLDQGEREVVSRFVSAGLVRRERARLLRAVAEPTVSGAPMRRIHAS